MSEFLEKAKDQGAERNVLSIIMTHGVDAFIEADTYITNNDFTSELNRGIYLAFKELATEGKENFDPELVKSKLKELKKNKILEAKENQQYIAMLIKCSSSIDKVKDFCRFIKKHSIVRELYLRFNSQIDWLESLSGKESISEILTKAEETIVSYVNGADIDSDIRSLTDTIDDYVKEILESEIVDQIGIPTGYPIYDDLIGGGLRPGTVNFIVARPKVGKSWLALNIARNIGKINIPILYLDSELTERYQQSRILSIDSSVAIAPLETGKFKTSKESIEKVKLSVDRIRKYPIDYQSIAGLHPTEVCGLIRRWIIKKVGFNENGKANPCVVIYDYLKLTSSEDLGKSSPEYVLLGLMMTDLSNLAIRYNFPIVSFGQMNREGIDGEETSVVAGSDRILWLCSNLSIFKNKTEEDDSLGCGFSHGNKKLIIKDTRQGSGHIDAGDYINMIASLRPGVEKEVATGFIKEGLLKSQIRNPTGKI